MSTMIPEDVEEFGTDDVTTNSVTISTIRSAKGFDYSCVFLVGLDLLDPVKCSEEQALNLTYVGITRARYQLFIPYVQKNGLTNRMVACL